MMVTQRSVQMILQAVNATQVLHHNHVHHACNGQVSIRFGSIAASCRARGVVVQNQCVICIYVLEVLQMFELSVTLFNTTVTGAR